MSTSSRAQPLDLVDTQLPINSLQPRIPRLLPDPQLNLDMDAGPPMKFKCSLCLVSLPSQAQMNKHLKGKEHMKREWRGQIDRQDLEDCQKIIELLEKKVQENEKELLICKQLHDMDKQQLIDVVTCCQKSHMSRASRGVPLTEVFEGKKETPAAQPTDEAAAQAAISSVTNHPAYPGGSGARPKTLAIIPNYTKYGARPTGP